MEISHQNRIVRVQHQGSPDAATAQAITDALRPIMRSLLAGEGKAALLHDATAAESAPDGYLQQWAAFAKEFKGRFLSVAIVPKAWVRVLAKTVVALSGIDMHVFKNEAEALEFLQQKGFTAAVGQWRSFDSQGLDS